MEIFCLNVCRGIRLFKYDIEKKRKMAKICLEFLKFQLGSMGQERRFKLASCHDANYRGDAGQIAR